MLINGPRTWKYAVPAAIVILLVPVLGKMVSSPNPEIQYWSLVPIGFIVLFSVLFLVNLWKYVTAHTEEMFDMHQAALSITPLVLLSENMKQMHPEAVRVLNRFGVRTSWQVRVNANLGERDWVLADTNVHFGFIEFVLSRSGTSLYPRSQLSPGSKKWDPDGLMEDRVQHEEFERWLFARLMVTRSHGDYKPAEFIPPWNPKLILEVMGLTGDQDLYRPDAGVLKDLTREQVAKANGNGSNGHKKNDEDQELTDEDMAAIEAVRAENAMKYVQDI